MPMTDPHHRWRLEPKFGLILLGLISLAMFPIEMGLGQEGWVKHAGNPVLARSEAGWDSSQIVAVSVLKEQGTYRMWYSASNSTNSGIGLAVSTDGVNWDRHPGNPLIRNGPEEYDVDFIFAPTVVRDGEGYKMWYTGSNVGYVWTIDLATSPDGIAWTKHPQNPVLIPGEWYDAERVGDPWVILDEGTYRMWYTCQNRNVNISYGIAYATSEDGVTWTKHPQNPVLLAGDDGPDSGTVRDACVLMSTSGYEMWYRGIEGLNWTICHATSDDGVAWTRYGGNPVLWGEKGMWDARVWFPRVLQEEGVRSMWYTSADTNEIGYAHLAIAEGLIIPFALALVTAIKACAIRRTGSLRQLGGAPHLRS